MAFIREFKFTRSPPRIPEIRLPENCVLEVASAVRVEVNRALAVLRDIASGRDLKKFLGVCQSLPCMFVVEPCFLLRELLSGPLLIPLIFKHLNLFLHVKNRSSKTLLQIELISTLCLLISWITVLMLHLAIQGPLHW